MRYSLGAAVLGGALLIVGCDVDPTLPPASITPHTISKTIVGVDSDHTMGHYSVVARHIAVALRDSATRMLLMRAMKRDTVGRLGIDLRGCDAATSAAAQLLAAGERGGAGAGSLVCTAIKARQGGVLYMDRDRLNSWDGSTIPIVTAVEDIHEALPARFDGYLTQDRIVELPADGSLRGPILVILPLIHPGSNTFARNVGTDHAQTVKSEPDSVPAAARVSHAVLRAGSVRRP